MFGSQSKVMCHDTAVGKKKYTNLSSLACLCSSLLSKYSRLMEIHRTNKQERKRTELDADKITKKLLTVYYGRLLLPQQWRMAVAEL